MLKFIKNQLFGKGKHNAGESPIERTAAQLAKLDAANKTKSSSFPNNYLDSDSMFK